MNEKRHASADPEGDDVPAVQGDSPLGPGSRVGRYVIERALAATRQLAKRQLTWLRKWPDLVWIYTDRVGNIVETTLSDHGQGSTWEGQDPANPVLNYLGINPI